MKTLSLDSAHKYILQTLDELKNLDNDIMLVDVEGLDTQKLVDGYIIEAVLKAHSDAPSYLIDGVLGEVEPAEPIEGYEYDYSVGITDDLVANITMLEESARLVSLQASDSNVVVVDHAAEESPIGRMQNNEYIRGTYDDPRLIVKKVWENDKKPEYKYYCVTSKDTTFTLEYFPYPEISTGVDGFKYVYIADKLEYAVLNLLVGMVLDSLSLHDKANLYKAKYQEYLQTAR